MSDIMRRVITLFDVRGSDRVRASLAQMASGFGSYRREIDMAGRSSSLLNSQLRAIGTTLRYSFAGASIYGTMQLVRNLGQFQARLGEIQAIASGPGGGPLSDTQIDQLGQKLIDVSNRTAQPIDDLQQGVLSLYSTIGDVPGNQAADMMETISKVALTSQSNIEDTTQALLGMIDAFGQGTDQLGKFGDEFFNVIKLSAGMPGHVYAQQLGRLSASATLSGFTPEQMGALAIGATRFGGSAATNQRGLAQMMTFLMNPTSPKTQAAFSSIGLGRAERNRLGAWGTLQAVLSKVNQEGGAGTPKPLTDDMSQVLSEQYGDTNVPNSQLGMSGMGGELLAKLFPRIEGRRITAVLARLQNENQVAGTPNKTLDQYLQDVTRHSDKADDAMKRAMDYKRIQQASNAMHNFGVEVGTAISPLLQYPARGITSGVSAFNNQHRMIPLGPLGHISSQTAEVAGGALGLAALFKVLRGTTAGGHIGRGIPLAAAGMDVLSGDKERGHSPLNPLYVAVVYNFGQGLTGRGSIGIPNQDMRTAREAEVLGGAGYGAGARAAPRGRISPRIRSTGGGILGAVGFAYAAQQIVDSYISTRGLTGSNPQGEQNYQSAQGNKLLQYLGQSYKSAFRQVYPHHPGPREQAIISQYAGGKISAQQAENRLRRIASPEQLKAAGINLRGQADVTVHLQDSQGNRRGSSHVAVDLFPDFTTPAPQSKGKPKTQRGGQ